MPNIQINNLPLYTGDTTGTYIILNNSGETTTYKTTKEIFLDEIKTSNLGLNNLDTKNYNSTGTIGEVSWDSNYLYVCVDDDTWNRVQLGSYDPSPCINLPSSQETGIMADFWQNNVTGNFTLNSDNIFYSIVTSGSSTHPTTASTISVTYTGRTVYNNTVFDSSSSPVTFGLSGLVMSWQIMLPYIGVGGRIRFVSPSSLNYGCSGAGSIKSYSALYYDVTLISVT
jgi:hypothetical protein